MDSDATHSAGPSYWCSMCLLLMQLPVCIMSHKFCMSRGRLHLNLSLYTGGKLEKGPAALVSCLEDVLRTSAPPPPPPVPSMLSPMPPGSGRRSARSTTVSPVRQAVPLQAPLPPDTPGSVMMEDNAPWYAPRAYRCAAC